MLYEFIQYFGKSPYQWTVLLDSQSNNEQTIRHRNFHTNLKPYRCFHLRVIFCKNLTEEYYHVRRKQQKAPKVSKMAKT